MPSVEMYGWDEYREEGLRELKRIKSSEFFRGKTELIDLLDRYIRLYEQKKDVANAIKGSTLYPELASRDPKAAFDKAYREVRKLREELKKFYKTDEGKESEFVIYFVAKKGDYRLGVKKRERWELEEGKIASFSSHVLAVAYGKTKDVARDLAEVYLGSLYWPSSPILIERCKESDKFSFGPILFFIFTTLLVGWMFQMYLLELSFRTKTSFCITEQAIRFLLGRIENIYEFVTINLLSLRMIILSALRFFFLYCAIPWFLFVKVFKGRVGFFQLVNFQTYYLLSWVPIFVWMGLSYIRNVAFQGETIYHQIAALILLPYFILLHFFGLKRLCSFGWVRGILAYASYFALLTTAFRIFQFRPAHYCKIIALRSSIVDFFVLKG